MNYTPSLTLLSLLVMFCLVRDTHAEDEARRYNILQFGNSKEDHILYKPDMKPFESAFTVCAWVRKLRARRVPTWFSYAVSEETQEIQITDMGARTYLFGSQSNLESEYTTVNGKWFHNCMSWSAADQMRYVYIDGELVDRKATPYGRTLGQNGIVVIGNEQETGVGTGMDDNNRFSGELYKLNMYSKILKRSEIEYMAEDRCSSYAEERHGDSRHIRWEDILDNLDNLQANKNGSVYEVSSGCSGRPVTERLLEQAEEDLIDMTRRLEDANAELEEAKDKISRIENQPCPLSETVTSLWDVLYSNKFFGETLTKEVMEEVRESWEKIGSLVGAEITEDLINFFKLYVD